MKTTSTGKTVYVAISANHAVRIRAYSKPKATFRAALEFANAIKGWTPDVGGIVDKASKQEVRQYLREHKDIEWLNNGAPIDV